MKTKFKLIAVLGILVAVNPSLGLPLMWKNVIFVVLGLSVTIVTYFAYKSTKKVVGSDQEVVTDSYVERVPQIVEKTGATHETFVEEVFVSQDTSDQRTTFFEHSSEEESQKVVPTVSEDIKIPRKKRVYKKRTPKKTNNPNPSFSGAAYYGAVATENAESNTF